MNMEAWPPSVTLTGEHVSLVELSLSHEQDLVKAANDGELHSLWYTMIPRPDEVRAEIERRLALRNSGSMLPFSIIDRASDKVVGMTTYMNIDQANLRIEIGSTWFRKAVQRSALNTECKLLLLRHAFEQLNCIAVEFRTHIMNTQSRRAIERLGAKLDGIIRSHMIMKNDTIRDTASYSIIKSEWPAVEANLLWQLEKPR